MQSCDSLGFTVLNEAELSDSSEQMRPPPAACAGS